MTTQCNCEWCSVSRPATEVVKTLKGLGYTEEAAKVRELIVYALEVGYLNDERQYSLNRSKSENKALVMYRSAAEQGIGSVDLMLKEDNLDGAKNEMGFLLSDLEALEGA